MTAILPPTTTSLRETDLASTGAKIHSEIGKSCQQYKNLDATAISTTNYSLPTETYLVSTIVKIQRFVIGVTFMKIKMWPLFLLLATNSPPERTRHRQLWIFILRLIISATGTKIKMRPCLLPDTNSLPETDLASASVKI